MLARLRLLLVKTPVLIAAGLILFYLVFGYLLFPPLAKWGAEKFIASKTGHVLTLAEAKFDPLRLTLTLRDLKLATPDGQPLLGFDTLFVDVETRSLFKWAYTLREIRLDGPTARLELRPDGSLNWTPFLEAFKDEEEDKDDKLPRLLIDHIALAKGEVEFIDRKVTGGFETRLQPIDFELNDLSTLPEDKGDYTLATRTQMGARVRWKGDLGLNPILATGELAVDELPLARLWPYIGKGLDMAPPGGKAALALHYNASYADKHLALALARMSLVLEQLALQGKGAREPAIKLARVALTGGKFDLDKRQIGFEGLAVKDGRVALRRSADGRLDIQDWFGGDAGANTGTDAEVVAKPEAGSGKHAQTGAKGPGTPWKFDLARLDLDGIAVRLREEGFIHPLDAEVGNLRVGLQATAEFGSGEPKLALADIQVSLGDIRMTSAASKQPLMTLQEIALEGGGVDLQARQFKARRLALSDGRLAALRDGRGNIDVVEALKRKTAVETGKRIVREVAEASPGWGYRIDDIQLTGFQVAVQDSSVRPAARLTLDGITASTQGLSQDLKQALPVKLAFRVKEGGSFDLAGKVVPATGAMDARVRLRNLRITPVQPYLSQLTRIDLASGHVSSQGRLRYGKQIDYVGGFAVNDLLVNEAGTQNRLLAWKHLGTDKLKLTDKLLDIDELALDGLGIKLVIHQDKSINFKQALSKEDVSPAPAAQTAPAQEATARPAPPPTAEKKEEKAVAKGQEAFKVVIDRINVRDGVMDFADLSLALPFGTQIHHLGGFLDGIASEAGGRPSQLALEGQVDDYGQARANGAINLFDPTGFTDIKVVFRNVEMNRLTPYSATFAGRRIKSGKLSLDLEYKIKDRQLAGDNQIIMDKLTLGERVESPTARNLPLDLAIAILSDSDGRIDLGLPVSGSLDDPEFSYGRIIWKAVVNVITKIVTAPFRALGKLLGGGAEKLENLAFDPGIAKLAPPERETLKNLAQALEKRPKLALSVQGTWDPAADRAALKESRVRAAVAKAMAIKLAEGEAAPPVPMANPKAQDAIEALYGERLGKDALKAFKARYYKANPERQKTTDKMLAQLTGVFKGEEKPLSGEQLAELKGKDLHPLLYQGLLKAEPVDDAALQALARQRAQAIADEMVAVNKVARERVQLGKVEPLEGDGKRVGIKLSLVVAPAATPVPAESPQGTVISVPDAKPQAAP